MQQEGLLGTVTHVYNEMIENRRTIHAVATQLVSGLLLQLRLPLPVPDVDSRLLGEGRAAVEFISVADSKSIHLDGDSFEVPSSLINVKVRVTVTVQLRCEGELLYLGYDIQKGLSGHIAIYVFEGSKVIDIDLPAWSAGSLELDLALYFVVGFRREYVHRKRLKLIRSSEN